MKNKGGLLKKAGKVIIILVFIGAGFFCLQKNCWAIDVNNIIINEVMPFPAQSDNYNEWIEIYNSGFEDVDLSNYTLCGKTLIAGYINHEDGQTKAENGMMLSVGKYAIITDGGSGTEVYSNFQVNSNALALHVNASSLCGGLTNAGKNITLEVDPSVHDFIYSNAKSGKSFSLIDGDIQITNPTPGVANQVAEPELEPEEEDGVEEEEQEEDGDEQEGTELLSPETTESDSVPSYSLGDVVINEFVSDPADGEVEWIELYNTIGKGVILDGWTIEEGSGAKTKLEGEIGLSGENKFYIIEKPKGNLNNKGDIIILRDGNANLIDQVAYGNWDDGNTENNAPVVSDPYSVARKFDGQNSYNNLNDFDITTTLTKGASNIITVIVSSDDEEEISAEEREIYDFSNDIVISEIFPNPVGSDSENEFIELFNKGSRDVDLTGWRLGDESKKRFAFKEGVGKTEIASPAARNDNVVGAGNYIVIYRSESKIALNNNSDSVKLYQPLKDKPLQAVKYEKVIEGWSYNNVEYVAGILSVASSTGSSRRHFASPQDDKWIWSEVVTAGQENIIKIINHPPIVEFDCSKEIFVGIPVVFDSSDTIDEDGDELEFNWDFGDGIKLDLPIPEHTYLKSGDYVVKLVVSDGENKVKEEKIIKVISLLGSLLNRRGELESGSVSLLQNNIVINEILPNPEGTDKEGEWIEIKNIGDTEINLLNWKLDDSEGGSKPFMFDSDLWLGAGMFYTIDRVDSNLALNNSVDAVRLFNNFDELIDEIEYEKVIEGESYARGENDKLFWTTVLTPGKENIITVSNSKIIENNMAQSSSSGKKSSTTTKKEKQIIETTLEKIKEFESGELVKVKGVVAVKPGVLGAQYFYIVGSPGIQIYNYKKDFPNLQVGDYIEVSGELSVVSGEQRIKTKISEDMKILEHRAAPSAEKLSCEKITDESVGQLVSVTGEVVERKSSIIYLDDGTDEVVVYIKTSTGINPKSIKEGEIISVIGIVGRTKSGVRVMPRSNDDIIKKDIESGSGAGQVLGEVAVSDEWEIAKRDKKLELFKYLLVIAGAVIVVLVGLLIRQLKIKN